MERILSDFYTSSILAKSELRRVYEYITGNKLKKHIIKLKII